MEHQKNEGKMSQIFNDLAQKHMKDIYKMRRENDEEGLMNLQEKLFAEAQEEAAKLPEFKFTPEEIAAYTTVGGTPHLDGEYTVFGEVVEGLGTTEDVTYGNMEYTVKRDTESETPLYAIGNPSFAYMDVKEFLKMNLTLTPFVYRHIESPTVGAGEGSEVILYLNRNSGELHKVLSKNELRINALNSDSLQDIDDAMLQYIAPGRGFRVMGGDFKPLCIEPRLLGYDSDAECILAPVSWTRTGSLVNNKNTTPQ